VNHTLSRTSARSHLANDEKDGIECVTRGTALSARSVCVQSTGQEGVQSLLPNASDGSQDALEVPVRCMQALQNAGAQPSHQVDIRVFVAKRR
jgi:hypothetical protein